MKNYFKKVYKTKYENLTAHVLVGALFLLTIGFLSGVCCVNCYDAKPIKAIIIQKASGYFTNSEKPDDIFLVASESKKITNNSIVIYQNKGRKRMKLWESPVTSIWNMELADIDGDGRDELALCLYKTESHDPKPDNRLQIYAWGKNGIYAKWRGTFLCRPFKQALFIDLNNDSKAELVSLETWQGKNYLCVYCWNDFGFDLVTQRELVGNGLGELHTQVKEGSSSIKILLEDHEKNYKLENNQLVLVEG